MFRRVSAAVALSLTSLAFAQTKAPENTPQATPAPKQPNPAENLLMDPSFENPVVKKRSGWREGGDLTSGFDEKTNWAHFQVFGPDKPGEGKLSIGLTNEYAKTGKQSLFVDFDKMTALNRRSFLMSSLMPVKPGATYRIGIWGRTDKKRPLTLDQRVSYLKTEVEFFTPDMESQAGDVANRTLVVPGTARRMTFTSSQWSEYSTHVKTPRSAGWLKVTFRWETGRQQGMTDGTIYFDDASVKYVPGGDSLIPVDESDEAKPETEPEPDSQPEQGAESKPAPAAPSAPKSSTPTPAPKKQR